MDTNKLKELGAAWKALDDKYDTSIQELVDVPEPLSSEKLEMLQKMQEDLFNLEVELFKVLQA
ncbi:hypothetical protein KW791_01870 [Candidatus Parcubacteria bacterium]|nr:hypothetical protein [Candidatus Parcubacteria bacterium]